MGEQVERERRTIAEGVSAAPHHRLSSLLLFVLVLLTFITGPLSLAHATMHHLNGSAVQDQLPVERNYAEVSVGDRAGSSSFYQGSQPLSPEQAMLEQNCVVCQWLQAAPLRLAHQSERRALADFAYAMPFASQATEFTPPPLQRPPRS